MLHSEAIKNHHSYNQSLKARSINSYTKQAYVFLGSNLLAERHFAAKDKQGIADDPEGRSDLLAKQLIERTFKRNEILDPLAHKNADLMNIEAEVANPQTDASNMRRQRLVGQLDTVKM